MGVVSVGQLSLDPPVRLPAGASVRAAAARMEDERVSCVFVGPRMAVVTEHDLGGALASGLASDAPVELIATSTPVWVTTSSTVADAVSLMVGRNVRHLVVISAQGEVLGTVGLAAATASLLAETGPARPSPASAPQRPGAPVAPAMVRTVAVGFDGSPDSGCALRWACALARQAGARIVVVHAIGLLEHADADRAVAGIEAQARSIVTDVGAYVGPLDFFIAEGDPCIVLSRATESPVSADLVVIGSRGRGAHHDQVIGSTGHHMIEKGIVPLVVVPLADES